MRYFLAIILPPVAVFLCGKPIQAILCFFLTFIFWIPGAIYALMVVSSYKADQRTKKMIKTMEKTAQENVKATIQAAKITAKNRAPVVVIQQEIVLRIAKNGSDLGDMNLAQVRQLIQIGQLDSTDYYFDFEKNDWVPLGTHPEITAA